MNFFSRLLVGLFLLAFPCHTLISQEKTDKYIYPYTHHMSDEEKALFHLVGKGYKGTDPPPGIIRSIAEFEQVEGVLIAYPNSFGLPYPLIAAMSEETTVTTIVANNNQLNNLTNLYQNNGVNMDNVNFLVAPMNTYWTRDYGPWFVRYGNDQIGIVDFIYNRPNRPLDNAIPTKVAQMMGLNWYGMDLIHAGGNYMTDGYGVSASTDLVWTENPSLNSTQINQMMLDYLGINTYHVVPDPTNTYIDHIDTWAKFIGVDKIMIREVPTWHAQYNEIEAAASYFASQTSGWGNPYKVYRVYTPNNQPYTNSLILNNRVFVPITGSTWDNAALQSYADAMPGYEILGFTGSWQSTDALHCRTIGLADRNMLHIYHMPLLGNQPIQNQYFVMAEITAYSGANILNSDVKIFYSINDEPYQEQMMYHTGGKNYVYTLDTEIPGSKVEYYLSASDVSENTANHPYIGAPDPHVFYVGEEMFAALLLDVDEINATVNQGSMVYEYLAITNNGGFPLYYSIEFSTSASDNISFSVPDSPAPDTWNYNNADETGWHKLNISGVDGLISGWEIVFDWQTDFWPEEGAFYVQSPSGTIALIAAGILSGSYTFNLKQFVGEPTDGDWKFWISDANGDGGHLAYNIVVTLSHAVKEKDSWLTVEPVSGTVQPSATENIQVIFDANALPVGEYQGSIWLTTNDSENPLVEIPVFLTVELSTQIYQAHGFGFDLNAFPNPFSSDITFEFSLSEGSSVSLEIFNVNGQIVKSFPSAEFSSGMHSLTWNGTDESGRKVENGIYFYRIIAGSREKAGKLILKR